MGRSRYAGNKTIAGRAYASWRDPTAEDFLGPDILDGVETITHVVVTGDRLDSIANRYYGDAEHWWVIALSNRIMFPLSLSPGRKLKIPTDPRTILAKVQR